MTINDALTSPYWRKLLGRVSVQDERKSCFGRHGLRFTQRRKVTFPGALSRVNREITRQIGVIRLWTLPIFCVINPEMIISDAGMIGPPCCL